MKCKNCAANIENMRGICPICGAENHNEDETVYLNDIKCTTKNIKYKSPKKEKKRFILSSIAVILIFAVGSFVFFYSQNVKKPQPELSFVTGQGMINKDEHVVYAFIKDPSHLECINGVSLYEGELDATDIKTKKPLSTDYKYTKGVDEGFRAIFFDMDDLGVEPKGNYTYTFQMTFSFVGDENWYTYYETVNVTGTTKLDVTKVIFDYSMLEYTTDPNQEATQRDENSIDFIYADYWYTPPVKSENKYSISAIKFKQDNTCVVTNYHKTNDDIWETSTAQGSFEIENNQIKISLEEEGQSAIYNIDTKAQSLTVPNSDSRLSPRKYNSYKNALDFFGL